MKRRFIYVVRLRELTDRKPSTTVTLFAKNPTDAEKIASKMFPSLRVWDSTAKPCDYGRATGKSGGAN